jgi:hypothetical protein
VGEGIVAPIRLPGTLTKTISYYDLQAPGCNHHCDILQMMIVVVAAKKGTLLLLFDRQNIEYGQKSLKRQIAYISYS